MKRYLFSSLGFLVAVFSLLVFMNVGSDSTRAIGNSGTCSPSNLTWLEPTDSTNSLTLTVPGPHELRVTVNHPDINRVIFMYGNEEIGRARNDVGTTTWVMLWDARYYSNTGGVPQDLKAVAFKNSDEVCVSTPKSVDILIGGGFNDNLQGRFKGMPEGQLELQTQENDNFEIEFIETSGVDPQIIEEFAIIKWSKGSRGVLSYKSNNERRYSSGSQTGQSFVRAEVIYSGKKFVLEKGITIYPQTTTTPEGNVEQEPNDPPSTTSEATRPEEKPSENDDESNPMNAEELAAPDPREAIERIARNDEVLEQCIIDNLGSEQYERLKEENRRPRSGEFREYLGCFSDVNNVIPGILAPVDPQEVREKKESKKVAFKQIKNEKVVDNEGNEKVSLVLSGTAEPNSEVLIYVFSEPLVLATVADDEGNWSYTLENPLESGEHEVYALVDRGDGEYERSSVASFVIGQAEATEENPNGYGLELLVEPTITASNRSINIFIASLVGVVSFGVIVLASYIVQKKMFSTPPPAGPEFGGNGPADSNKPFGLS